MANDFFVHSSSFIDDHVEIGAGVKVWHFAIFFQAVRLAKTAHLARTVWLGLMLKLVKALKYKIMFHFMKA